MVRATLNSEEKIVPEGRGYREKAHLLIIAEKVQNTAFYAVVDISDYIAFSILSNKIKLS